MAYTNRTIRIDFPELGDDIWVSINNPMLMPVSLLSPRDDVKLDAEGHITDRKAAVDSTFEIAARLIVSWNVYDPMDDSAEPQPFGLPATVDMLRKLPMLVVTRISEIVGKAIPAQTS